jgi:hypothetical protein
MVSDGPGQGGAAAPGSGSLTFPQRARVAELHVGLLCVGAGEVDRKTVVGRRLGEMVGVWRFAGYGGRIDGVRCWRACLELQLKAAPTRVRLARLRRVT